MADETVGAIFDEEMGWHDIDWEKVHRNVRRQQARIVKAIQAGRWGKVQSLQHLLTRSFSGKALAVKRVTENKGKNTPGVDGVIWDTPKKKMQAVHELRVTGYRPQPLRRVYIPKSNHQERPLGIPMMPSYCTSYREFGDFREIVRGFSLSITFSEEKSEVNCPKSAETSAGERAYVDFG